MEIKKALNLGCGTAYIESNIDVSWANIDIRKDIRVDKCISVFYLKTLFEDNSIDYIWHSHLLEHLIYPDEAVEFLKICYDILKPNGIMRLGVPDLQKIATFYAHNEFDSLTRIYPPIGKFFYKFDVIGERFNYFLKEWSHQFYYDYEIILKLLHEIGFKEIRKMNVNESKIPNWNQDRMELETLFVECEKIC